MQTLRFMLASVFVLADWSMAGSVENSLPGIGIFAYSGPLIASSASPAMVLAVNEK